MGQAYQPTADDVASAAKIALDSLKENCINAEIAFFGGSFTAIDRKYMLTLLDATKPYIDKFKGIRISTRPDCIDDDVLSILKSYKTTAIELGAQSMSDKVLKLNKRGHTADDVIKASRLIKDYDISLGLQMMTGLYGSTYQEDVRTAEKFISIKPDTVRIYPTIVMKNTELESRYLCGEYKPQQLDEAVRLCCELLTMFSNNDINVIRLGLHHSNSLDTDMVAGPYHPSFRELCESKLMLNSILKLLDNKLKGEYSVKVAPQCVSKLIGNKKSNLIILSNLGYTIKIVQDPDIDNMQVVLQ